MLCDEKIEVWIEVNGSPLQEYPVPDPGPDVDTAHTRLIEVTPGDQFSVVAKFKAGFSMRHAPLIYMRCEIDQNPTYHHQWQSISDLKHQRGILTKDALLNVASVPLVDPNTTQWTNRPFTIGPLGITDDTPSGVSISLADIANLGSIRVSCFRAKTVPRDVPWVWHGRLDALTEIPERVAECKGIKNNVQFSEGTLCDAPQPQLDEKVPVDGKLGTVHRFIFLYRNQRTLQLIGCLPRSPSPKPDLALMLERTEAMLQEEKQRHHSTRREMRGLSERLKQLEQTLSSVQNSSAVNGNEPKEATLGSGIASNKTLTGSIQCTSKRSREDGGNDCDTLEEVAPPPKKPAVVIDLSDDD